MTSTDAQTRGNRLARETSPYLLQHAFNPVDWYPWGDEAFAKARGERKPIFLSIGYAACHWCHVMEHESFEDERIAEYLNRHYVSIKVDREERPDLDDIYMQAVQMMTGSGGWPMTVFLDGDGRPFYGGTYFPPQTRYGRIGFLDLLEQIHTVWTDRPEKIAQSAQAMREAIEANSPTPGGVTPDREVLRLCAEILKQRFDATHGGFGGAPKFPPWAALRLLLNLHVETGELKLLEMVDLTLRKMALGGIHDHLGGGFHRYSVDHRWLAPHFEKMLYDNALLAPLYFDAALVTGDDFFCEVGRDVLDYVLREMTDPRGGFYSTQDADSEGHEGKFYTWRPEQIEAVLDADEAALFTEFYDISADGNWDEAWEGGSILNVRVPLPDFARMMSIDVGELRQRLSAARGKLLAARAGRIPPLKDDKVLAGWNGLMIEAMARGAQSTGDSRYRDAAVGAAVFVLSEMRATDGRLLRTWRDGQAKIPAFLEDYANTINGLVSLYETTFDSAWLTQARELTESMLEHFHDPESGGFFTTDGRDPTVIVRVKEFYDGATPSGNAAAVHALLRLSLLLDEPRYGEAARGTLALAADSIVRQPSAHHHMLAALDFESAPAFEIALVGESIAPHPGPLLAALRTIYLPQRVIALSTTKFSEGDHAVAPLRSRGMFDGKPTAYVCRNRTCQQPTTEPAKLLEQLEHKSNR